MTTTKTVWVIRCGYSINPGEWEDWGIFDTEEALNERWEWLQKEGQAHRRIKRTILTTDEIL